MRASPVSQSQVPTIAFLPVRPAVPANPALTQALDAWLDEAGVPAEERPIRAELRTLVLDWQRRNNGRPANLTTELDLSGLGLRLGVGGPGLRQLPAAIGLLGNLSFLNVTNNRLTELPPEIWQLPNLTRLDLSFNRLERLPAEVGRLQNLRTLVLSHNLLAELPPAIIELARRCRVESRGCPLPPPVIAELQAAEAERNVGGRQGLLNAAPRFQPWGEGDELRRVLGHQFVAAPRQNAQPQPPTFAISPDVQRALSTDRQGQPIRHADSFFSWLNRVMGATQDAGNPTTRQVLQNQLDELVRDLLDDVNLGDVNLRALCFAIADDAMASCGDGAVHGLNDMHVAVMNAKALRDGVDEKTLIGLGIDKFVLTLIESEAQAKITALASASGRPGDDVETRLFFQTQLREPLAHAGITVPLPTQTMLYAGVSGVSLAELSAAAGRIRAIYHDGHSKAEFLAKWPPLSKYVENTYKDRFAAVVADFQARSGELDDQSEKAEIDSQAYVDGMEALMRGLKAAQTGLHQTLVADVVKRNIPPSSN